MEYQENNGGVDERGLGHDVFTLGIPHPCEHKHIHVSISTSSSFEFYPQETPCQNRHSKNFLNIVAKNQGTRIFGHANFWARDFLGTRIFGHANIWAREYLGTWARGHARHAGTWAHRARRARDLAYSITSLANPFHSSLSHVLMVNQNYFKRCLNEWGQISGYTTFYYVRIILENSFVT